MLTRTDSGGETLSTWRIGSAYGAAFLSNQWYPDRLNTTRLGLIQGSVTLGFDLVGNLGAEFWPDIKKRCSEENDDSCRSWPADSTLVSKRLVVLGVDA